MTSFAKKFFVGSCIILTVIVIYFPWDRYFQVGIKLSEIHNSPSFLHPFGQDHLGRDLLYQILLAIKQTVIPLWIYCFLAHLLGFFLGLISIVTFEEATRFAVICQGLVHRIFMVLVSIPLTLQVFIFSLYHQNGFTSIVICLSSLFCIQAYMRIIQLYLEDSKLGYWQSHKALGGSLYQRLMSYGINGRWLKELVQMLMAHMSTALVLESSLSYLGFGVQEPRSSFGNIITSHFDLFIKGHFFVLLLVTICFILIWYLPNYISRKLVKL